MDTPTGMDGADEGRDWVDERAARDLVDYGFALSEVRGQGPFRLPARDAFGLWHQDEGTGTLVCPIAGPLEVGPGGIVLHDVAAHVRGEHPPGGRAIQIEFGRKLLREVALMEFGTQPPAILPAGARHLTDPTLGEMARAMWRVQVGTDRGDGARGRLAPDATDPAAITKSGPKADGMSIAGDRATLLVMARALATRLLGHHVIAPDRRVLDARLALVLDHIEDHIDTTLRLRALAEVAGLSTYHFSRTFSRRTGETVQAYVRSRRVERARRLLTTGELPLAEIAYACGFAHQSHFTATFREATGETPGAFRERVRMGGLGGAGPGGSGPRGRGDGDRSEDEGGP